MNHYDAIVVGVGGVGSSALFHLADRGAKVLGLDRFAPGHDRGSSHGKTRLLRRAYFEHPDYVPLVDLARDRWKKLEERSNTTLLRPLSVVHLGDAEGDIVKGVRASAAAHDIAIDELDAKAMKKELPDFVLPDGAVGLREPDAALLDVERCVEAYAEEAIHHLGAELRIGATVRSWAATAKGVSVETESGQFTADKLVVTAGPWAKDLLLDLCIPFEVRRKPAYWYEADEGRYALDQGAPAFLIETPEGTYTGFPQIDGGGVKVWEHSGGQRVPDPLAVDRGVDTHDQKRVEAFLDSYLPGVRRRCMHHTVCMYTMSPDGHMVIGKHTESARVCFAAGLSGHGFKFASILGEILADFALDDKTDAPIDFLRVEREGLAFTDLD